MLHGCMKISKAKHFLNELKAVEFFLYIQFVVWASALIFSWVNHIEEWNYRVNIFV